MTDRTRPSINQAVEAARVPADGYLSSADLFRDYAPFVASFLLRMGVGRVDLDDLIQEVFLVAHKIGGYSPGPAKPTTFLANIAVRAATTHRRKGKTRAFVRPNEDLVGAAAGPQPNPERSAQTRERLVLFQRALDRLDADKRAVFLMADVHGETVVSIAAGLGIPVDTAYSRLRAARKIFRQAALELRDSEGSSLPPQMEGVRP